MELQTSSSVVHDDGRKRHCWECRRRRLVCDSTEPTCTRCQQARIVCPGYDDHQPLRWLTPGKVTSRTRRPKANKPKAKPRARKSKPGEEQIDGQVNGLEVCKIPKSQVVDTIMRFELKSDDYSAMKAVYYYTIDMYYSVSPLKGLVCESRLGLPPMSLYRYMPLALRYMFISIAMSHHINRLPPDTDRSSVSQALSVLCYWNGLGIRALNELINTERTQVSDVTISGTLMLMACDLQQNTTSHWRYHYDGLTRMIKLRGGLLAYYKSTPHMRPLIAWMVITEALANSTSPYNDQITRVTHPSQLDAVRRAYGDGISPAYLGTLCPPELLLLIIRINHLRAGATHAVTLCTDDDDDDDSKDADDGGSDDALDILRQIEAFSPEASAGRKGLLDPDMWILLGRIYQSAVALYCVLSLQSVGLLPLSSPPPSSPPSETASDEKRRVAARVEAAAAAHYDRILPDLQRALAARPQHKSPLLWPLAVAGVRAGAAGSSFERAFVAAEVRAVGRHVGSAVADTAAGALERFWRRGAARWDECFDRPLLLLT